MDSPQTCASCNKAKLVKELSEPDSCPQHSQSATSTSRVPRLIHLPAGARSPIRALEKADVCRQGQVGQETESQMRGCHWVDLRAGGAGRRGGPTEMQLHRGVPGHRSLDSHLQAFITYLLLLGSVRN